MTALAYALATADQDGIVLIEPCGYNSSISVQARYCHVTGLTTPAILSMTQENGYYTACIDLNKIESFTGNIQLLSNGAIGKLGGRIVNYDTFTIEDLRRREKNLNQ